MGGGFLIPKKGVEMARSNKIIVAAIAVILLGGGSAAYAYLNANDDSNKQETQQEVSSVKVTSKDSGKTVAYEGQDGKTALELLKNGADVKTQTFDYGEMVSSINGVTANESQFWGFYVNGEMAPVGAGEYKTKNGEEIKWQLEEIDF